MTPGRNEPCPCGSGRKYKRCHGQGGERVVAAVDGATPEQLYRQTLARNPDDAEALAALGVLLYQGGRLPEAEAMFRAQVRAAPGQAAAHGHLGAVLLLQGQAEAALPCLQQALALNPAQVSAWANLGAALKQLDRPDAAEAALREALARDERIASVHSNLGALLMQRHDPAARRCFDRAIALEPQFVDAHFNLASLLREQGHIGEAIHTLRRVITLAPGMLPAWGNLLLSLLYADDVAPAEVLAWHRRFDTLLGMLRGTPPTAKAVNAAPEASRPLRVGLLSPDLRRHAVASFVEPLLEHHDNTRLELFCYHDHTLEDEVSARLKRRAARWANTAALAHTALAERIRLDGIDVLLDLAGPTGLRMPLLAGRAAPVQASWLGYPASTGLAAMDHRLSDAQADPPGHEALHTEALLRLPHSYFCFRPPADAPAPGPLPVLADGHLCFGSFNNISKLGPATVALWAQVLRALPTSRLLLKAAGLADSAVRERLMAAFAARGVTAGRIEFQGWQAQGGAHLALYHAVDIALDPTPYNGATTSCEALWMGVPVISLAGDRSQARMGASILAAAGCSDWIAHDADGFVAIARRWAAEPAALQRLRAGLRGQLRASPLLDGAGFARDFEHTLHTMWAQRRG